MASAWLPKRVRRPPASCSSSALSLPTRGSTRATRQTLSPRASWCTCWTVRTHPVGAYFLLSPFALLSPNESSTRLCSWLRCTPHLGAFFFCFGYFSRPDEIVFSDNKLCLPLCGELPPAFVPHCDCLVSSWAVIASSWWITFEQPDFLEGPLGNLCTMDYYYCLFTYT